MTTQTHPDLDAIKVLYRSPDGGMGLWGIPYDMRPGQSPRDLARARNTDGWVWLGQPGWWGDMSHEECARREAWIIALPNGAVPEYPGEWSRIADFAKEGAK